MRPKHSPSQVTPVDALVDEAVRLDERGDARAAAKLYRRAAERGDLSAMVNLGALCAAGRGVRRSPAEAMKWWRRAARQGDGVAMANIGVQYRNAGRLALAERWFWRAQALGRDDAALDLARVILQRNGSVATAKAVLRQVLGSPHVCEADQEEAEALLAELGPRGAPE